MILIKKVLNKICKKYVYVRDTSESILLSISAKVFAKQIDKNQIALQMLYFVDAGAKTASI